MWPGRAFTHPSWNATYDARYMLTTARPSAWHRYFVKRGYLHVLRQRKVLRSVREGSFLGEVALLRSQSVRTVDVRSVTDSVLLALDVGSFNLVVAAHEEYGDGRMQSVLKKNAYMRYNVRITDESPDDIVQSHKSSGVSRRLSRAVVSLKRSGTIGGRGHTSRSGSMTLTPGSTVNLPSSPGGVVTSPHPSDLADAAAEALRRNKRLHQSPHEDDSSPRSFGLRSRRGTTLTSMSSRRSSERHGSFLSSRRRSTDPRKITPDDGTGQHGTPETAGPVSWAGGLALRRSSIETEKGDGDAWSPFGGSRRSSAEVGSSVCSGTETIRSSTTKSTSSSSSTSSTRLRPDGRLPASADVQVAHDPEAHGAIPMGTHIVGDGATPSSRPPSGATPPPSPPAPPPTDAGAGVGTQAVSDSAHAPPESLPPLTNPPRRVSFDNNDSTQQQTDVNAMQRRVSFDGEKDDASKRTTPPSNEGTAAGATAGADARLGAGCPRRYSPSNRSAAVSGALVAPRSVGRSGSPSCPAGLNSTSAGLRRLSQTEDGGPSAPASGEAQSRGARGRATLAETWALSGKEAMALALSQGRFDRQMERHTEGLREDMSRAIAASEKRIMDAMAAHTTTLSEQLRDVAAALGVSDAVVPLKSAHVAQEPRASR